MINDQNVKISIKRYKKSSKESYWIPLAIRSGCQIIEFYKSNKIKKQN